MIILAIAVYVLLELIGFGGEELNASAQVKGKKKVSFTLLEKWDVLLIF